MFGPPEVEYALLEEPERFTTHPLAWMSAEELTLAALRVGVTVAELRHEWSQEKAALSCALCGRPRQFLSRCLGCGAGSFGDQWLQRQGADVRARMRERLAHVLDGIGTEEQIEHAVEHAFWMGGCRVCGECWLNALPGQNFQSCPLYMFTEVNGGLKLPAAGAAAVAEGVDVNVWIERVRAFWVVQWNTVEDGDERLAVGQWRNRLLIGVAATVKAMQGVAFDDALAAFTQAWRVQKEASAP